MIQQEKWRGECFFLLSDNLQAISEEGKRLCGMAAPFQEDCLRHVAARDVELNLFPLLAHNNAPPMKVMPRIYSIVQHYLPAEIAQPMARDMLLRRYASVLQPPFSRASCQGMDPDMCSQLYIIASLGGTQQWNGSEPWFEYCGQSLNAEIVNTLSWVPFTSDAQETVDRAFKQICQAGQQSSSY